MFTVTEKQVSQILIAFKFCKKVIDGLAVGTGISYNKEDMLQASNSLSVLINALEAALSEEE